MKIAILGWGSLLWECREEFDQQHGPWKNDGPTLKLEFSRVSKTRLGALTLVIDEDCGALATVAWCLSTRVHAEDVARDLRCREGTTLANIGCAIVALPRESTNPLAAEDQILAWARPKQVDAVVWTALKSNFREKVGEPFCATAAMSYVKTLTPEGKARAAEYVWRAPIFVQTPVRSALQNEPWFGEACS